MSDDQTRIGDAEREAALAALQQHLTAGRIELDEFEQRSAAIARARTVADLAPVFADLPQPHPSGPVSLTKDTARPDWREVRRRSHGPLGGPLFGRLGEIAVGLSPFIAMAIFFGTGGHFWLVWLLIPMIGGIVYGNRGGHQCGSKRREAGP